MKTKIIEEFRKEFEGKNMPSMEVVAEWWCKKIDEIIDSVPEIDNEYSDYNKQLCAAHYKIAAWKDNIKK